MVEKVTGTLDAGLRKVGEYKNKDANVGMVPEEIGVQECSEMSVSF